jgi:hypothetical protein
MTSERLDLGEIAAMTGFALSLIPQGFPNWNSFIASVIASASFVAKTCPRTVP